jgi:hypothetical protein
MDEDFVEVLQTHMQRLTNSAQQDTEFLLGLAYLSQADPSFLPIYQRFLTINSNRLEAILSIVEDISKLSQFNLQLSTLLASYAAIVHPPLDNSASETQGLAGVE